MKIRFEKSIIVSILFIFANFAVLFCKKNEVQQSKLLSLDAKQVNDLFVQKSEEKAVLINLWATWCGPCVEEFPDLVYLADKYKDELNMVFISGDFPDDTLRVMEFLKNQRVNYTTWIKTGSESEFIEAVHPEWSGALPFTLILKKGGEVSAYWENKAELAKLENEIQKVLTQKKGERTHE